MEANVRSDEISDRVGHSAVAHDIEIDVRDRHRVVDTAKQGLFGRMAGCHVEPGPTVDRVVVPRFWMRPALLAPCGEVRLQASELLAGYRVGHHQPSISMEAGDLFIGEHGGHAPKLATPPR